MWKILTAVVDKGMKGMDVSIRSGLKILCDFKAPSPPFNVTCSDNKSRLFLQSDQSLTFITDNTDETYYLEYNGVPTQLKLHNETFDTLQEALSEFYSSLTQNLTDLLSGPEESPHSNNNLLWLLLLLLIVIIVLGVILWNKFGKRRTKEPDLEQTQPLANGNTKKPQETQQLKEEEV